MPRTILLVGAGKSASYLIHYLLEHSRSQDLVLQIADKHPENLPSELAKHERCQIIRLDIADAGERRKEVEAADIVISMLPPSLHLELAKDCLECGRNLVTASYVSEGMRTLDQEVRNKGLVFLNEMGLDPGIDHMSAMQVIDRIKGMRVVKCFCFLNPLPEGCSPLKVRHESLEL